MMWNEDGGADLAEISRPLWNNNEPLGLPPSETRGVSMMMKTGGGRGGICACMHVDSCVCLHSREPAPTPQHHLGTIK